MQSSGVTRERCLDPWDIPDFVIPEHSNVIEHPLNHERGDSVVSEFVPCRDFFENQERNVVLFGHVRCVLESSVRMIPSIRNHPIEHIVPIFIDWVCVEGVHPVDKSGVHGKPPRRSGSVWST